jgi:hypothetical protein
VHDTTKYATGMTNGQRPRPFDHDLPEHNARKHVYSEMSNIARVYLRGRGDRLGARDVALLP